MGLPMEMEECMELRQQQNQQQHQCLDKNERKLLLNRIKSAMTRNVSNMAQAEVLESRGGRGGGGGTESSESESEAEAEPEPELDASVWSIKLQNWDFLLSGAMAAKYPALTHIDLTPAWRHRTQNPKIVADDAADSGPRAPLVVVNCEGRFSVNLQIREQQRWEWGLSNEQLELGLRVLVAGCPCVEKLCVVDGDYGDGAAMISPALEVLAQPGACPVLQELDILRCSDASLRAVSCCKSLHTLRAVARVPGLFSASITDIGLTQLARNCAQLIKLHLCSCQGSYAGISAIGQCCPMLQELILTDHEMERGWTAGLYFYSNLKILKLESCKEIDANPSPDEHVGYCSTLETLHISKCNMRDKKGLSALVLACSRITKLSFERCWGLEDDTFSLFKNCSMVKHLSLQGCSCLTTAGLEAVIMSWQLTKLHVYSCKRIKDAEISPGLANLFRKLTEWKWSPDSLPCLSYYLKNAGMGNKGGRFFKKI